MSQLQTLTPGWSIPGFLTELFEAGEGEVCAELLRTFLAEAEARLKQLKEACRDGREEEVRKAAHRLSGSCSQFGADAMLPLAEAMEANPKSNLCEKLEREFAIVQAAMQSCIPAA
jgi:HPt (histidine-containing phosphotransfer) domain-containing protein